MQNADTANVRSKIFFVFAKRPFGGASRVIEYPGRYTHKVASSNHRLQSIDNGKVAFTYKDYDDDGKVKTMTLAAPEFLRRFCLHILPKKFRKIRHYGLLSSRNKKKFRELQTKMSLYKTENEPGNDAIIYIRPDFKAKCCLWCGKGKMHIILNFGANAPPSDDVLNSLKNNTFKQAIS
jgi:hypothetical protein